MTDKTNCMDRCANCHYLQTVLIDDFPGVAVFKCKKHHKDIESITGYHRQFWKPTFVMRCKTMIGNFK